MTAPNPCLSMAAAFKNTKGTRMNPVTTSTTVHIFVELNKNDKRKVVFENELVTGLQIKQRANVPSDYDLARRQGQKLELITDNQTITIKNGEHFVALPPGTIS